MAISFLTTDDLLELEARISALENVLLPDPSDPPEVIAIPLVWHANSGDNSERRTNLPISGVPLPIVCVVYSVQLPEIFDGDLIEAWGTFEVTNPYNYDMMVCRQLIIGDANNSTTGVEVSEPACRNVTPGMHHDHTQDFGSIRGTAAMSGKWVIMTGYANNYNVTGHAAILEQDYGRLIVKVTRKVAMEN